MYLDLVCSLCWCFNPPKEGQNSNQKQGPIGTVTGQLSIPWYIKQLLGIFIHLSHEQKNLLTFHYTGCFIGILIYNDLWNNHPPKKKLGSFWSPYIPKQPGSRRFLSLLTLYFRRSRWATFKTLMTFHWILIGLWRDPYSMAYEIIPI